MNKKVQKLSFKPYSQADVNALLAAVPLLNEKIKAVRVNQWFDKKKNEILFGIEAKGEIGEWCSMCDGARALIFSDKKLANLVCRTMKKELSSVMA